MSFKDILDNDSPLGEGSATSAPVPTHPLADLTADPPPYTYSWDFNSGLGPWTSWFAPSVVHEEGGQYEDFTRLHASGPLDANHLDGVGAIWLVAHLSTPALGSPGILNLKDAEFQITMRGTDFEANGGKLALWVCRYVPETGLLENVYVGLEVTNWANTGGDMAGEITDDWTTITLKVSSDPADWTYAGHNASFEGDWADRYQPFDLQQSLEHVDATLHLVMLNPDPDNAPTGFLDVANITLRTQTPAIPEGYSALNPEVHYGLEDQVATGVLAGADGVDMTHAAFSLVGGSAHNGTASVDPVTGAFTFTPDADYFGFTDYTPAATFQYTVTDGVTTSDPITVLVYVGGINDAPIAAARDESADISNAAPYAYTVFAGTDIDGDSLNYRVVPDSVVGGTISLDAHNGRYVFTPTAGFVGDASFSYIVSDGQVDGAPKTVTLHVHAPGDTPALPDFETMVSTYLLTGDYANWIAYAIHLADAGDVNAAYHYGTWLNSGVNGVTRDKALARHYLEMAVGTVPDANLQLATQYLSGEGGPRDYVHARELLAALPDDPVAIYRLAGLDDLGFGAPQDHTAAIMGYLKAANMGSGDAAYTLGRRYLAGESVPFSASDAYFWLGIGLKLHGGPVFPVNDQGTNAFIDLLHYNQAQAISQGGLTPEQITALDAAIAAWDPGETSPVNDAPVLDAGSEDFTGDANQPVTGNLTAASDSDGDRLVWQVVADSAQHGAVSIDPVTGAFVFTPTAGFSGEASFRYVVTDGIAASAEQVVHITVNPATGAIDDVGETVEDQPLSVSAGMGLLANDSVSPAGSALHVAAVEGQPSGVGQAVSGTWGDVVIQADGSWSFTPNAAALALIEGQSALQTFVYTVTDEAGVSATATLSITIDGVGGTVISGGGVVIGSALGDVLTGGAGYDVLIGLAGDDVIRGGPDAADELYGGAGDDTYVIESVGDTIVEQAGEGTDTIRTAVSAYVMTAANIENLTYSGTAAFTGTGNSEANVITGGGADDVLAGRGGADQLVGGAGRDTADYSLAAGAVDARLNIGRAINDGDGSSDLFTSIENLTGSNFADLLIGDGGGNVLSGGLGRDTLLGLDGNDTLIGGGGVANQMQGGRGDDSYVVTAVGDTLIELADEGTDTVRTSLSAYTLGANIENLVSTGPGAFIGTGNGLDNRIEGGLSADVLTGANGDDVLIGGAGNDSLYGGAGSDTADYSSAAAGVDVRLSSSEARNDGFGSRDLLNGIENLTGSAFADLLVGDAGGNVLRGGLGRDTLLGMDGNDILIGGSGTANQMQGGRGDDVYSVSAAGDTIIELAGEGVDSVETSLTSYSLQANVENLTYTGAAAFVGTGNVEDNIIRGGAGDDVLTGAGGDDNLRGGDGHDVAVLTGVQGDYDIVAVDGGWRITDHTAGRDGVDLLTSIEALRFADGSVLELDTLLAVAAVGPTADKGFVEPLTVPAVTPLLPEHDSHFVGGQGDIPLTLLHDDPWGL